MHPATHTTLPNPPHTVFHTITPPILIQCVKHINSTSGQPFPVSFRLPHENHRRKQGKISNISHFHFFLAWMWLCCFKSWWQKKSEPAFNQVLGSLQSLYSLNTHFRSHFFDHCEPRTARKYPDPSCFNFQNWNFSKTNAIKNLISRLCSTFKHNHFAPVDIWKGQNLLVL